MSQKNFIDAYEKMLVVFEYWGESLLKDIEDLTNETSNEEYRNLKSSIENYYQMGNLLNIKSSTQNCNYVQLKSQLRRKVEKLDKDSSFKSLLGKLNISQEDRDKFNAGDIL